ncbi:MAG: histidinol dehydrogenase [bacterium]|jgi:histidinol dehydrogenase
MEIKIAKWAADKPSAIVTSFLKRPAFDPGAETAARATLEDIRLNGDSAVLKAIKEFDGVSLNAARMRVTMAELAEARETVDAQFRSAARETYKRVTTFSRAGMKKDWKIFSPKGGELGEQFVPLDRVGVYIPGGQAPLVSTVFMTVTLARVAGVQEIVVCTPSDANGKVNPYILFALEMAGATEIYRVGGIQAIGLMAYGTKTVTRVQKIVGPGGAYVTAAKKLVYGEVALDLVAGPSEIAILADDTAHPECVAADLLSQAEHGTGLEKAILVTTSSVLATKVSEQLLSQAETLPRKNAIHKVLDKGTLLVIVNTLDEGMDLCNQFAPEHFEIMVREPRSWLRKVRTAGAVFFGMWTPESVGDFVAGPSHVLPTGGTATMFSGLTVDDFRRRTSFMAFTRADLQETLPVIEAFGRVEGLEAHARAARVRFEV